MVDKVFKIGLLVFCMLFLVLFYFHSKANRYSFEHNDGKVMVFDTATARLYVFEPNIVKKFLVIDTMNNVASPADIAAGAEGKASNK